MKYWLHSLLQPFLVILQSVLRYRSTQVSIERKPQQKSRRNGAAESRHSIHSRLHRIKLCWASLQPPVSTECPFAVVLDCLRLRAPSEIATTKARLPFLLKYLVIRFSVLSLWLSVQFFHKVSRLPKHKLAVLELLILFHFLWSFDHVISVLLNFDPLSPTRYLGPVRVIVCP